MKGAQARWVRRGLAAQTWCSPDVLFGTTIEVLIIPAPLEVGTATTMVSTPNVPPAPRTSPPGPVRCSAAQRTPRNETSPPAMSMLPKRTWADARRSFPSTSSAVPELLPSPDASSGSSPSAADV